MQHYTVTITPDDGDGAQTIVRLEVNGNVPQIKELRLTAGRNGSLSTAQLPAINLEMLLAAVMPAATTTPSIRPPAAPRTTPPVAVIAEPVIAEPVVVEAAAATVTTPKATTPKPTTAKATAPKATTAKATTAKSAAPKKAPATAAPKTAAKTTAKKAVAKTTPKAATKTAKPATGGSKDRVYRSMPEDFVSTYNQAPTIAALAEVYGVPVYTAQNWINTARKREMIPAARSRRR